MNTAEQYAEMAERIMAMPRPSVQEGLLYVAEAQVYATLSVAAATLAEKEDHS